MENYTIFREIADNWFLVWLFSSFIAAIIWAFRPGSRGIHKDSADIPFRHEDRPVAKDATSQNEVS